MVRLRAVVVFVICVLVLGGSGCAFSPVARPVLPVDRQVHRQFPGDQQALLSAAAQALQSMGYAVAYEDADSGLLTSNVLQIPIGSNCDCGTWNGRVVGGTSDSSLEIRISPDGSDTQAVAVEAIYKVRFTGRNLYGDVTRDEVYQCRSLATKEKQFLTKLGQYLSNRDVTSHATDATRSRGRP